MNTPKLRMLAGPNGSGKTTLFDFLREHYAFHWGQFLNPDAIDRQLSETGAIAFGHWNLKVEQKALRQFVRNHPLVGYVRKQRFELRANVLRIRTEYREGYFAAILCDFMRRKWIAQKEPFTFETVMSSRDKVDLLREAKKQGYRTYLYYICTDRPSINEQRILNRRHQGGHGVPAGKIRPRYDRSLGLLAEAIAQTDRAYLFDNSGTGHRWIAEFESGRLKQVASSPPKWVIEAVLLR